MAKTGSRSYVILRCSQCGYEIRPTTKNKVNNPDRLEIKKFCPKCRKPTIVKEKK